MTDETKKTRAPKTPRPLSSYGNKAIKEMRVKTAARLKAIDADIARRKSEFDTEEPAAEA